MKLKAFILGLFVFALAASVQAQHIPSNEKRAKIEKPVKYKGDKKVVSRKQSQRKATDQQSKVRDKKMLKAKKHKRAAYKKGNVAEKQAIRTKKYEMRKAHSKAVLKQSPVTH